MDEPETPAPDDSEPVGPADEKPEEKPENPEPEQPLTPSPVPTGPSTIKIDLPSATPSKPRVTVMKPKRNWKKILLVILALAAIAGLCYGAWKLGKHSNTPKPAATVRKTVTSKPKAAAKVQGLQLDPSKDYGNKYADGLLPVGDGKYSTSAPAAGTVYACSQYAQNLTSGQGGAQSRGLWFTDNNTEYDVNKKVHVNGSVMWQASFSNNVSDATRTIVTNDLPNHPTGVFPVAASDAAYAYDRNPNSIKGQTLSYSLPSNPTYGNPNCMGGQSGIMLTGVALFNAFDAGGRDAGAWEVQDACSGHPQKDGEYHYHTLSACIKDTNVRTVIGYALDGFPITGPQVAPGNILTTSDLDECHGITSQINLDGKLTTMYHYVMTQDFPYSVSCFRGQAIQPPGLPG
ncbi:MAG TPA: YHYH protein [Candidatus Saccharimonadia bacterium]|nr:YHYH protein [Candidatus Saccharimonadia bacterium]